MNDIVLFMQHHWQLSLALVVVLFLLMLIEIITQKRGARHIGPAQATLLINHGHAAIVDVRSAALFAEGHIIDAISIPFTELADKTKKLEKYKSKPIIITCASGHESSRAASTLRQQGFDVRVLAGGIRAWNEANMPLVKG